jgi:hypothetical protein
LDVILSGYLPKAIYRHHVTPLLKAHPELDVLIAIPEEVYDDKLQISEFCQAQGLRLSLYIPGIGLKPLVQHKKVGKPAPLCKDKTEPGFCPQAILGHIDGLKTILFRTHLVKFKRQYDKCLNDPSAVLKLVRRTIEDLLNSHPAFEGTSSKIIRLLFFEELLRLRDPSTSEHVLHSFRVFIAGCIIIDRHYEVFQTAHSKFAVGASAGFHVEFTWLLTALLHDIGYVRESFGERGKKILDDDDTAITLSVLPSKWTKKHYILAKQTLSSLICYIARNKLKTGWDGGTFEDSESIALSEELIQLYSNGKSHAVISAIESLARIIENGQAAKYSEHRPFILTHSVPAAVCILLHDWRLWNAAKAWRIFPVSLAIFPMAGLLIYIDTWDDFKRHGNESPIQIPRFEVNAPGCSVSIQWYRSDDLDKESVKYSAFYTAITDKVIDLDITVTCAQ